MPPMSDPRSNFRWEEVVSDAAAAADSEAGAESDGVTVSGGLDAVGFGFALGDERAAPAGTAAIRGHLDAIAFDTRLGWVARGWAVDDLHPQSPVEVEIVEREVVLGRGIAAQ